MRYENLGHFASSLNSTPAHVPRCKHVTITPATPMLHLVHGPHLTIPTTTTTMAAVSVPSSSSPITQVSQTPVAHTNLQPQLLTRLQLDLRGERFSVDRETIMNLPESVLLCLFPNGLVLSRQSVALSDGGGDGEEDEEVYGVDVSKICFV